jgi:ribonuclease HII
VLAKCARDAIMIELSGRHPEYGWALNKGYSAPEHVAALREHGPCVLHRRSWNLPIGDDPAVDLTEAGPTDPDVELVAALSTTSR